MEAILKFLYSPLPDAIISGFQNNASSLKWKPAAKVSLADILWWNEETSVEPIMKFDLFVSNFCHKLNT